MFFYAGPRNHPQPVEYPYVGRVETGERRSELDSCGWRMKGGEAGGER